MSYKKALQHNLVDNKQYFSQLMPSPRKSRFALCKRNQPSIVPFYGATRAIFLRCALFTNQQILLINHISNCLLIYKTFSTKVKKRIEKKMEPQGMKTLATIFMEKSYRKFFNRKSVFIILQGIGKIIMKGENCHSPDNSMKLQRNPYGFHRKKASQFMLYFSVASCYCQVKANFFPNNQTFNMFCVFSGSSSFESILQKLLTSFVN